MYIHFIGIGGIGVSALARYFLAQGHKISGSDLVSSEITNSLKKLGAKISIGPHISRNVLDNVNLVIYSPAVLPNNPEIKKAKKRKIKCRSYPQVLGELTKKYFTIAVCGSHGKSTVAAMIGILLTKAGFDPTVIVGTKVKEFNDSNFRMGAQPTFRVVPRLVPRGSAILVIEADEHFASFLNYWPKIIVLTAIEADHLDFYKNFKNILKAFKKFILHLPKDGILVVNKDDKNIKKLLKSFDNNFSTIGQKLLYYSMKQKDYYPPATLPPKAGPSVKKLKMILKVPGEHNIANGLAALTVARILKIPDKISFKALSEFQGTWRHFDIKKLEIGNWKLEIVSDYAHHPTQIKATLKAAREKFPKRKIWCIFQPHQYQRTYYLFDDFVKVFRKAPIDKLIITDIFDVAGREDKEIKKKVSSKKLVESIKYKVSSKKKEEILYIPTMKETTNYLRKNLQGKEVVIIMGAGNVYKLVDLLIDKK